MNKHLLRLAAARLGLFLAPFLVSLLGWLGLVNPEDVPKVVALISNHLTELIFGVMLLAAGLIANLRNEWARTNQALALPENSTHAELHQAVKQRGQRRATRRINVASTQPFPIETDTPGPHHDDQKGAL